MRLPLVACMLAGLSSTIYAHDKPTAPPPKPEAGGKVPGPKTPPTPERLAGTWTLTHIDGKPAPDRYTVTYTVDGKITERIKARDGMRIVSGTYRLEGNALHIKRDTGPIADDEKVTVGYIRELTDDTCIGVGPPENGNSWDIYKRVIEKVFEGKK